MIDYYPNSIAWYSNLVEIIILAFVPLQTLVNPLLLEPNISGEYLIALVHIAYLHEQKAEFNDYRFGGVVNRSSCRIVVFEQPCNQQLLIWYGNIATQCTLVEVVVDYIQSMLKVIFVLVLMGFRPSCFLCV